MPGAVYDGGRALFRTGSRPGPAYWGGGSRWSSIFSGGTGSGREDPDPDGGGVRGGGGGGTIGVELREGFRLALKLELDGLDSPV